MSERTEQEEFVVAKMSERYKALNKENQVVEKVLEKSDLSDEDYDLYQGLMDKNIGEMNAMRRMEDDLREWREIQRTKAIAAGGLPNEHCDFESEDSGEHCLKSPKHLGGHVNSKGQAIA